MKFDDRPEEAKRLEKARIARGFKTAKDAAKFFGWPYPTYAQHEKGTRGITRAATDYARAFRVSEGWLITGDGSMTSGLNQTVPIKGKVGAGQQVEAIDNGDLDEAPMPPEARPDTIAVIVDGTSMFPAIEDGSILYYSRHLPAEAMVNRRAVVQLADGRVFVKVIRPGSEPGLWTLQSVNSQYADIQDVVVEWAAPIDWIRPR